MCTWQLWTCLPCHWPVDILSTNQMLVSYCINQSEASIMLRQPIRSKYHIVLTNQTQVSYCVDQSEASIILCWPIRSKYHIRLTNQKQVLGCVDQSEASITCCTAKWFNGSTAEEAGGGQHGPAHDSGQGLDPGHLVLADLTQDEVPQLLGLVAEQQHSPVLTDHSQHLLTNMNHQLCLDYCVITWPIRDKYWSMLTNER